MKTRLHNTCLAYFIFPALFLSFTSKSFGQSLVFGDEKSRVEVGINVGPLFFLGDLGGHRGKGTPFLKDLNLPLTKLMTCVFGTVYPNEWLGVRVAGDFGKLAGSDAIINTQGVNELWRKQRNLDFRTNIAEGYVAAEIFPLMLFNSGNDDYNPRLRPYGVLGVGVFHFNPQGSLTDANGVTTWYNLQPLHTEGEGFPEYPDRKNYVLTQVNIPMGFGAKYLLSERVNLSTEFLYRHTFTDYIDDVSTTYIDPALFFKYLSPQNATIASEISDKTIGYVTPGVSRYAPGTQRGDATQMDSYFSVSMKLAVRLGDIFDNGSRRERSHLRCPARF